MSAGHFHSASSFVDETRQISTTFTLQQLQDHVHHIYMQNNAGPEADILDVVQQTIDECM